MGGSPLARPGRDRSKGPHMSRTQPPESPDSAGPLVPHQPSASPTDELRDAFARFADRVYDLTPDEERELETRVCAVVDDMKAGGATPERILIAIKRLAADAGVQWMEHRLFGQIINWCVRRYYPPPTNA